MRESRDVRVGDFMELVRRQVTVDPTREYVEIGIRSYGRGIFHKEPVDGTSIGSKRVFEIHPGELVFNTVFAWEGAVAVTTEQEVRTIGSHRFMTYQVDPTIADVRYLYYLFQSGPGLGVVRAASPGSAGRNRTLGIRAFAEQYVQLPSLDEQRRIAAKLDCALTRLASLERRSIGRQAASAFDASAERLVTELESRGWRWGSIGAVSELNPRRARLDPNEDVTFVPMSAVDDVKGDIISPEWRKVIDTKSGYTQFRRGDIIFARITPCMQNGKAAIFDSPSMAEYGYGSTEFHVIRPLEVSSRWVRAWVRRKAFRERAVNAFTGTAGQQRVPANFLRQAPILVAPSAEAEEGALARMDGLEALQLRMHSALEHSAEITKALRPSLLNAAFSGRL